MTIPRGLYETLLTEALADSLSEVDSNQFETSLTPLDPADSYLLFVRHVREVLRRVLMSFPEEERIARQAAISNQVIKVLNEGSAGRDTEKSGDRIVSPAEQLLAFLEKAAGLGGKTAAANRPAIPLTTSDLLMNARGEPNLGHVLAREFPSADRIDLLCAFIRWNGLRVMGDALGAFCRSGRPLRVLTTTYTGSTERRALDLLVGLGAQVKVSYDTQMTRLHAKAWLFHRATGFSTAYIGSSNLSRAAMVDGREWNVRLSQADAGPILEKFQANFEGYWADPSFETYDPVRDRERFDRAVQPGGSSSPIPFIGLDLEPFPHQSEILEKLVVERRLHGRHRNLVVAATGTGKTFVAAFDYKRLRREIQNPTLLYVAHRKEILTQSLQAFRVVLRDGTFGELYADGHRPEEGRHVFASIQSLSQLDFDKLPADFFDIVVVDEFHHAAASTYKRLLDHIRPKELIGLTATPERTDGQVILDRFEGRIAAEIRIWEALDRGLLCPFQYFGINDETDLSQVRWSRRGYDTTELQNLYTANDARVRLVVAEIARKVSDPRRMRALGFCVSIAHAKFMADRFSEQGLPSVAVSSDSTCDERDDALRRLRSGEVNVVFAVDLFNEGVDVPEIDTVLFLRPTESATVFLQQLGRGLRRAEGKECLTVLDFIGRSSTRFRFDLRYRALTGASRSGVHKQVEEGFPYLPAGCSIQLDRVASEIVLENLSRSIGSTFRSLETELRSLDRDVDLAGFLKESDVSLEDLYRNSQWSWSRLRRSVGLPAAPEGPDENTLARGFGRLIDMDDPEWILLCRATLRSPSPPEVQSLTERQRRILTTLHFSIWGTSGPSTLAESLARMWQNESVRLELLELLSILESNCPHLPIPLDGDLRWSHSIPLSIHCRYSLEDVLAAIGRSTVEKPYRIREGILFDKPTSADLFFVTLEKTEQHYSPSTLYRDYAISPELFHWESQNTTSEASPTGQRHIHHRAQGVTPLLFVRERRTTAGRTQPYLLLGPADYVSHAGERPMAITWRLRHPIPADFFRDTKVATG
jgi:superfamily II DNA or RNA helicase/HKD family nuclease